MKRFLISAAFFIVTSIIGLIQPTLMAGPCLIVYPANDCIYMYDPNLYYTVGPGHPLYDPENARNGEVIYRTETNEIDYSIYQAPNLTGFMPSIDGMKGYFFSGMSFTLILDSFSGEQEIYKNVKLVFGFKDNRINCRPTVLVNEICLDNLVYSVGDIVVSKTNEQGNNYSETMTFSVTWYGCYSMYVWAYADENYNGEKDGCECGTAFSYDITISTEDTSWGAIKMLAH